MAGKKKKKPTRRRKPLLVEVPIADIKLSPVNTSVLTPFMTAWAHSLFKRVGHLLESTFEQWESGFTRDQHPETELFVWECIATAYALYRQHHPDMDAALLVGCLASISMGGELPAAVSDVKGLKAAYRQAFTSLHTDAETTLLRLQQQFTVEENLSSPPEM